MESFTHLHTHSEYSFLDGAIPLRTLVEYARQLGMSALALTDHNGLYGAVAFYQMCREVGIKPIIGAQVSLVDGSSLVLLAKNPTGYQNLCQIISLAHLRGGHLNFRCEMKDIVAHKQGLFVLSGGKKGLISQLLLSRNFEDGEAHCRWMQEQFGENFYLEMQRFQPWDDFLNEQLYGIARCCGLELAATNDVHLLSSADLELRRVLHAIDQNTLRERVRTAGNKEQYLKSPHQMQRLFARYPQAIENTQKIADACDLSFSLGKPVFPVIEAPAGESSQSYLRKLCFEGARERYQPLTDKIIQRIEYELKVIDDLGFSDYFLIVKDIVEFCRREAIPCVGRGSAADSIVSYVLGITFADPIRFNLYFERFLNPERTDAPDIDLDICWRNRDRVLNYVYQKYGSEKTAMICTYNTFQSRAAIRDVAKTFGLPEEEIGQLTRYFPYMSKMTKLEETLEKLPELKRQNRLDNTYKEIIAICKRLAGFPRHLSIHAGGVIIAPDRITNYSPLEVAGKGLIISQFDMHSIERLGLVKMDLLGVRSLSIITECMERARKSTRAPDDKAWQTELIKKIETTGMKIEDRGSNVEALNSKTPNRNASLLLRCGENDKPAKSVQKPGSHHPKFEMKFDFLNKVEKLSPLDMRAIPEDDSRTIEMIKSGQTLGCFQLESPLVRGILRKMQTDNIEDTVVAVAVIRPGVGDSGMKDEYILRRGGLRPPRYAHPILEPVLKETYGLTIYQEQVLLIAQAVAGFSLAQADTLRRAMTKVRHDKQLMHSLKEQFLAGARNKGFAPEKAEEVWQFLVHFIGFGFNKAHAATYGILAYQSAFLKCYFPVEYMTAVLNNHGGFYTKAVYIEECRRMQLNQGRQRDGAETAYAIELLAPDVNSSEIEFTNQGEAIRVGLYPVFELSDRTRQKIVDERKKRPFRDLYDFLRRTRAGQKETEHLIRCGAMRSLHPSEPLLLLKTQSYFKNGCSKARAEYLTHGLNPPPYSREQRILAELELLSFAVTAHPLTLYDDLIPWESMVSSLELETHKNRRVQFTGWKVTSRLQETVTGKYMKFLSLEDKHGICEIIFFPEVYERYAEILHGQGPFTVTGKVQSRLKGEANLIAEKAVRWPGPKEVMHNRLRGRQRDMFARQFPVQKTT
ncbi:MAG: DNA polymerase III subunit alpha [bacterium]